VRKGKATVARLRFILMVGLVCGVWAGQAAWGTTANGNEVALYLSEAKTPADLKVLLDEGLGKQHFFRYLRISDAVEGETNGYPYVAISTVEPSSGWTVKFTAVKSISLAKLKEDPPSKVGDALAVTGVLRQVDPKTKTIVLCPVVVRYKDRLAPKCGKEMLSEVDNTAVVYSFTGGKEPINVSKRDADLLAYEAQITAEKGKDGWAKFLRDEIAKRNKAARADRDKLGIYRKVTDEPTPPPAAQPAQPDGAGVILDDE